MAYWKNFFIASSTLDALETLNNAPGPSRLIAGGTDLLLDLQQGRHPPVDTLVDVTRIPELNRLEYREHDLFIGAALPLNRLVASALLLENAQALVEACSLIGGPQVRNTATLGGNVAHALPAADGTIALMALDAQAEVASLEGNRRIPLAGLFQGPGKSTLDPRSELLLGFWLPLRQPGQASSFRRVMRPQGVAIAIINMCVWVWREGDRVRQVRIATGPSGPIPRRAYKAESVLTGQIPGMACLSSTVDALLEESHFRTSPHRASKEYRRQVAGGLFEDVFQMAWQRTFSDRD